MLDPNLPKNHPVNVAARAAAAQAQEPAKSPDTASGSGAGGAGEPAITRKEIADYLADLVWPRVVAMREELGRPAVFALESWFDDFLDDLAEALRARLSGRRIEVLAGIPAPEAGGQLRQEVIAALNAGHGVLWIVRKAEMIRGLVPAIEATIRVPRFNAERLADACRRFYGLSAAPSVAPESWIEQVTPRDLLITSQASGDPIVHLRDAVRDRLRDHDCDDATPMESLVGLNEAREWAAEFIADVHALRQGSNQLSWHDMERGVVLIGPPGAGKAALAQALCRSLQWRLYRTSGYDWTATETALQAMSYDFHEARRLAPCIMLVEDIDQMPPPLAQRLRREILDCDDDSRFVVIATSSRSELLVEHHPMRRLLDSCHLERFIAVPLPTAAVLAELFRRRLATVAHAINDEQFRQLGRLALGRNAEDVDAFVRRAGRAARRARRAAIEFDDIAFLIVNTPTESGRAELGEQELRCVAYHESGHAVMRYLNSVGRNDIQYLTVVPRADSMGFMLAHSEEPRYSTTERELRQNLQVLMGGRAAEEILLGPDGVTTGSAGASEHSDLGRATRIAAFMIAQCGYNEGRRLALYSGDLNTNAELRREVDALLAQEYAVTVATLRENWPMVQTLADRLIAEGELSGDEVRSVLATRAPASPASGG